MRYRVNVVNLGTWNGVYEFEDAGGAYSLKGMIERMNDEIAVLRGDVHPRLLVVTVHDEWVPDL